MRSIVFAFSFLGLGEVIVVGQDTALRRFSMENCVIDFESKNIKGSGIELGYSSLKEVQAYFGQGNVSSKKDYLLSPWTGILFELTTEVDYPQYGIRCIFKYYSRIHQPVLIKIMFYGNQCTCKSEHGVGVGSTVEEYVNHILSISFDEYNKPRSISGHRRVYEGSHEVEGCDGSWHFDHYEYSGRTIFNYGTSAEIINPRRVLGDNYTLDDIKKFEVFVLTFGSYIDKEDVRLESLYRILFRRRFLGRITIDVWP
jgi:hypothetical protein